MSIADIAIRATLAATMAALRELPENPRAWAYTIIGFDQFDYLSRAIMPRVGGWRPVIHRIHRPDQDRHEHTHPWQVAYFMVASGGYVEQRQGRERVLRPGDVNKLHANDAHRVVHIEPNTWTVGLLGRRVADWGFIVDGKLVPHRDYFALRYALKSHIVASKGLT